MLMSALVATGILAWDDIRLLQLPRRSPDIDEVQFLNSIHAELRAGASLRWALAAAAGSVGDAPVRAVQRLALAGVPLVELAPALRRLPINGNRLAAALQVAALAGGRSADVFARLAGRAVEEADLARERRSLTTQVRLSAAVVGGLPLLWLVFGGVDRVTTLAGAGGVGLAAAMVGIGMELVGGLLVWRSVRA